MSDDTWRLVYFSHNLILGAPEAVEAEVRRILAVSQVNNRPLGRHLAP
jgi:hypothetical protein